MSIIIVNKNIVESDAVMVLHQVNCQHAMGSGVAKAIKEKWPIVYNEYMDIKEQKLGDIQVVKVESNKYVVNMFAQEYYGYDGKRYTSYDAFYNCLVRIKEFCEENDINKIALPYKIGSDRGGADWNVIYSMIESVFAKTNIMVEICKI